MPSYVIWIPFEFRGGDEMDLQAPTELNVCGYPSTLRRRSTFKGLEITGISSEESAKILLKRVTGALLATVIAQGPQIRFCLEPIAIVHKNDDHFLRLDPTHWEEPFSGSRTAIYRDDKQIPDWSGKAENRGIVNPKRLIDGFSQALALPSLQDGIGDRTILFAAKLYCSAVFEASKEAHFLALCTVLEVLAPTGRQPLAVAAQIDQWITVARAQGLEAREQSECTGLEDAWNSTASRLGNLKMKSIMSSVTDRVKALLDLDRCPDAGDLSARAAALYRKRHSVVHGGHTVTDDELFELDDIVRSVLIAAIRNPPPQ